MKILVSHQGVNLFLFTASSLCTTGSGAHKLVAYIYRLYISTRGVAGSFRGKGVISKFPNCLRPTRTGGGQTFDNCLKGDFRNLQLTHGTKKILKISRGTPPGKGPCLPLSDAPDTDEQGTQGGICLSCSVLEQLRATGKTSLNMPSPLARLLRVALDAFGRFGRGRQCRRLVLRRL